MTEKTISSSRLTDVLQPGPVSAGPDVMLTIWRKYQVVAVELQRLRLEHDLTQAQLAERIGCKQSRVSKIENTRSTRITIRDLFLYGEALGLNVEIVFRLPEEHEAHDSQPTAPPVPRRRSGRGSA